MKSRERRPSMESGAPQVEPENIDVFPSPEASLTSTETETESRESNASDRRIEEWSREIANESFKAAEMETSGLTREEIRKIGRQLASGDPNVFESAYEIHDFWLTDEDIQEIALKWIANEPTSARWITETLKMSNQEIKNLLNRYPPVERENILKLMAIPGSEGEEKILGIELDELERLHLFSDESLPEIKELNERIDRSRELSEELGRAILETFPDREPSERKRTETEKKLLNARFRRIQDIGHGSTAPKAAMLEGCELPAVYKLASTEPGVKPGTEQLRTGIEPGTGIMREWLAHQIGRLIAPERVPVTVLRHGPMGEGTLQEWEVGKELADTQFVREGKNNPEFHTELKINACFDQVVWNSDRNTANKQINRRGKLIDIDNGCILSKQVGPYDGLHSCAMWVVAGERVEDDIIRPYERLTEAIKAFRQIERYDFNLEEARVRIIDKRSKAGAFKKAGRALLNRLGRKELSPEQEARAEVEKPPSSEQYKLAKMVSVLKEQFELALKDDGKDAFNKFIGKVELLVEERTIEQNSKNWYWWDEIRNNYPSDYE